MKRVTPILIDANGPGIAGAYRHTLQVVDSTRQRNRFGRFDAMALGPVALGQQLMTGAKTQRRPGRLAVDGRAYAAADYAVRERYVELVRGSFPRGRANVEIDGVFGWLERRPRIQARLAADLAPGDTEAMLDDVAGLRAKDALLIDGHVPLILGGLDGTKVTGDPVPAGAPTGSPVVTYGRVPRPVERACLMLAVRSRHGLATDAGARAAVSDRIIEERTDSYMYRLAPSREAEGDERTTGDLAVDRLLADYVAPPYVGVV